MSLIINPYAFGSLQDDLTDIILRLDATDYSSLTLTTPPPSGPVSGWNDLSGLAKNGTQTNSGRRPVQGLDSFGKGEMTFNATSAVIDLPALTLPFAAETTIIVHKPADTNQTRYLMSVTGNGGAKTRRYNLNQAVDYGDTQLNRPSPVSSGTIIQVMGVTGGAGPQTQFLSCNGGTLQTGSVTRNGMATGFWTVGGFNSSGVYNNHYNGKIKEIRTYSGAKSLAFINKVCAFLAFKHDCSWSPIP